MYQIDFDKNGHAKGMSYNPHWHDEIKNSEGEVVAIIKCRELTKDELITGNPMCDDCELKPCPWCGGSAELHVQDGIEEIWLWFKCVGTDEVEGCGASSEGWDTLEGAVKRWNSRPEEDRLNTEIDRLKAENEELKACPFCGGEKLKDGYNSKYDIFCSRCGNFDNMKSLWNTRPIEDKLKAEIERLKAENKELNNALDVYLNETLPNMLKTIAEL